MNSWKDPATSNGGAVIQAEGLVKSYGQVLAVEGVSLQVSGGEVFGLLGPNGAGKTTILRILAALIAPSAGRAVVAGCRLGEDDRTLRGLIGLLPEAPGLYQGLSAERNLAFYATMHNLAGAEDSIERYLRLLGLWDRRAEPVAVFSKGMRQKLALARALIHEPQLLFLDEPTSGLDPAASRLVREFIEDLRDEGRTIVICTHNLEEADRLCDRVGVLNGRLLAVDTPAALRKTLFGKQVVFHLALPEEGGGPPAENFREALLDFEFVRGVEVHGSKLLVTLDDPEVQNPALVRALVQAGAEVQFVGELRHRLEDVYLQLMGAAEGEDG
jgi:ABC-2 type transport system ATP-binding protein